MSYRQTITHKLKDHLPPYDLMVELKYSNDRVKCKDKYETRMKKVGSIFLSWVWEETSLLSRFTEVGSTGLVWSRMA